MTVQIVRRDGRSELIQDVNSVEANNEKKVTLHLDNYTIVIPCCDFTSIIILKD